MTIDFWLDQVKINDTIPHPLVGPDCSVEASS